MVFNSTTPRPLPVDTLVSPGPVGTPAYPSMARWTASWRVDDV
jgi:hypothetical protein